MIYLNKKLNMNPSNYFSLSYRKHLCIAVAFLASQSAQANFNFVLTESAEGVLLSGSGSADHTGFQEVMTFSEDPFVGGGLGPTYSVGSVGNGYIDIFDSLTAVESGPSIFGSGGYVAATNGTGDAFGFDFSWGGAFLMLPEGYVANEMLSGTGFYEGESFASLGVTIGSYQWTFSDGQTVVLTVVPEPATTGLLMALLACAFLASRRRP